MVFTLQRYIFRELFKVFALATIGLTLILSLGGILQPVQEYGVGPRQVVHILLYFMPITLTFVLPMAALFASALTYGRFASDNELDACRASGIGVFTLVYPGLVLAILVATASLLLSFHVMPYFVHRAEKSLKADAKQIVFRNIKRRGFYRVPDAPYMIYADHADAKRDLLSGIVVIKRDKGVVEDIYTADAARVEFNLQDRFNEILLHIYGAYEMGGTEKWAGNIGNIELKSEFGSLLGDDIKFKQVDEIKQIQADPMRFDPIAKVARKAFSQLATELLAQDISATFSASTTNVYELRGPARSVRFSATSCALEQEKEIHLVGSVVVEELNSVTGQPVRTLGCDMADLMLDEDLAGPGLVLVLNNPRAKDTGQLMVSHSVRDLRLPETLGQRLHEADVLETLSPERTATILKGAPSSMLDKLQKGLARQLRRTQVNIKAEKNSRLVFGIGCLPMIMIGIGLGIINRGGHLLSAFGASCIPAAVLIVAVISGKHVTENMTSEGVSGIMVMWAGLAALTVLATGIYARLSKN